MIYGSICSGIEAASAAWHPLGWRCAFTSEIEPFACAVLAHHYPTVPNLGDMTQFETWNHEPIDILVGGTPCQSFSVAGLRKGLDDDRGNLTLVFLRIVARARPRWVVWENVPGVLSDRTGAFGAFLGGLGELGYGFAYRILDAQYFGVAQRRRRVFVVGHAGGQWQRAAAALFERESLRGDFAPRRDAGEGVAGSLRSGPSSGGKSHGKINGSDRMELVPEIASAHLATYAQASQKPIAFDTQQITSRTNRSRCAEGLPAPTLNVAGQMHVAHALRAQSNSSHSADQETYVPEVVGALATNHTPNGHGCSGVNNQHAMNGHLIPEVACALQERDSKGSDSKGSDSKGSDSSTKGGHLIPESSGMAVRRITPRECERLQGFPDDYTAIQWRGKTADECPDGPRYKALGNSMAVPVMQWIGRRIELVEGLTAEI